LKQSLSFDRSDGVREAQSFHASLEDFIYSRLKELAVFEPGLLPSSGEKGIIRASILNRNVRVVTSLST
jgi:hypothetical protein